MVLLIVGCGTCNEKDTACCKNGECVDVAMDCITGHEAVFQGCSDDCMPMWECVPVENSQ